ncbi:MAG: VOC family protein [Chloroflexi bacterium]|nr:MAG: VOC family protein [Chloroflexota bacterium]
MTSDRVVASLVKAATPYLAVRDARAAIDFYARAFGARQKILIEEPDGRIGHATLGIGSAEIYLADEHPEFENVVGPETLGGTSVTIDLEVDDVDRVVERAVAAGADLIRPPDHPESGVQAGKVRDPFGHIWLITRIIGP